MCVCVCVRVCATHLVQRKVFTVSESKESNVVSEHQVKHGLCWEGEETKGRRQKKSGERREGMILRRLTYYSLELTAQSNSLCELFLGRLDDQMVTKHVQCLVCACGGCVCV